MDRRGCFHLLAAALVLGGRAVLDDSVKDKTEVFDTLGCSTFQITAERCFVENVEVLPGIELQEVGLFHGLGSAQECQRKCAEYSDCKFFTFRKNSTDGTTACLLKPAPSYATSPFMVVRRYIDQRNNYTYVSGPADCRRPECTEEVDGFYKSCGGSTPGSCRLISGGLAQFDADCLGSLSGPKPIPEHCGAQNYKCCKYCRSRPCCIQRIRGKLLVSQTFVKGYPTGVESADHCWGLCVNHRDCTHWNYVESKSAAFVKGACFLHAYDPPNHPLFEDAPADVTSIIGPHNCTSDTGLNTPDAGFPKGCVEAKVTGYSVLAMWYRSQTAQQCQFGCQKYPGCHFWSFVSNQCSFLYDDSTRASTIRKTLFGPAYCDADSTPSNDCVLLNTNYYEGETITDFPIDSAHICSTVCSSDSRCVGWTWSPNESKCKLVATLIEGLQPVPGDISGHRECVLPDPDSFSGENLPDDAWAAVQGTEAVEYSRRLAVRAPRETAVTVKSHLKGLADGPLANPASNGLASAGGTANAFTDALAAGPAPNARGAKDAPAAFPPRCIQQNTLFESRRPLAFLRVTESLQQCREACLERPECKMLSVTADGRFCWLFASGNLIDMRDSFSVYRECLEDSM